MAGHQDQGLDQTERLFRVLAEQLKSPLLQIAQIAELGQTQRLDEITVTAETALNLVDSFILATEQNQQLQLEPVSVSSVLYDVGEDLRPLAKQHNCRIELVIEGKYQPVMANRQGLQAALTSLGHSFVEAIEPDQSVVVLAGFKSAKGISAGLFSSKSLSTNALKRSQQLYGQARQAMPSLNAAAGAGLYIAESLFEAMSAPLVSTRHHNLNGLAATFLPSAQLRLV